MPLALVARALRSERAAALGAEVLRRDLGISQLEELMDGQEELDPDPLPRMGAAPRTGAGELPEPEPAQWLVTGHKLHRAYASGGPSPLEILERLLSEADSLGRRQPWLRCLWARDDTQARADAQASAARYAEGKPLGPLDGVPVVVKEQIAVRGLPRRLGNDLPGPTPQRHDATLVSRLRDAGAIIVGLTAMTEVGMSPIGINPKRPPLRNPHHIERTAGGSSTGSGVAASLGLVPLAVGADGGGSVRIPAAICGVFGLKPSFGRVSRHGDAFSGSLNQAGPLGASSLDLARFLDAVCAPDPRDPLTARAPHGTAPFASAVRRDVRGLRIGVDARQLSDADPDIVRACEQALSALEKHGAILVDVHIPLASQAAQIGFVTIAAEVQATMAYAFQQHRDAFGLDMQVFMRVTNDLSAREYLWAQALREKMRQGVARLFQKVDVLALPATQKTALPTSQAEERTGRVDGAGVRSMCRHMFLANLTGLPAATAPLGLDSEGLPVSLQLVGDAWDEATLLATLAQLERIGIACPVRPPYHIELLG